MKDTDNMNPSNSIENKLSELIPASLSEHSLEKIDAIIDDLSQDGFSCLGGPHHDERQADTSVSWSDIRQWKVAAVFALLFSCSLVVASKFKLIEFSFSSDPATTRAGSEPLDIQPSQPHIMNAVVSSTTARPEENQQAGQSKPLESAAVQEQELARVSESLSISDESGTATLEYREGQPWLRVESVKGVQIYNNYINEEQLDLVPSIWRDRVAVLQQSLEESSKLRKSYRARYIPKSKHGFADSIK